MMSNKLRVFTVVFLLSSFFLVISFLSAGARPDHADHNNSSKEARYAPQKAIKEKIAAIVNFTNANRGQLEKEAKLFCKDISAVWYSRGDFCTIDLLTNNTIVIDDAPPIHVQIAEYDPKNNSLIAYVLKNGKIGIDSNGKLFGLIFKKVIFGGNQFNLGISLTDGKESGPQMIYGRVRALNQNYSYRMKQTKTPGAIRSALARVMFLCYFHTKD